MYLTANLESGSVPVDPRAEPSDFDMSLGLLPIEKWLTKIQINDRDLVAEMESVHRFGQVGRLGKYPLIKPQCMPNDTSRNKDGELARQQSRSSDFRIQRSGVEYGYVFSFPAQFIAVTWGGNFISCLMECFAWTVRERLSREDIKWLELELIVCM